LQREATITCICRTFHSATFEYLIELLVGFLHGKPPLRKFLLSTTSVITGTLTKRSNYVRAHSPSNFRSQILNVLPLFFFPRGLFIGLKLNKPFGSGALGGRTNRRLFWQSLSEENRSFISGNRESCSLPRLGNRPPFSFCLPLDQWPNGGFSHLRAVFQHQGHGRRLALIITAENVTQFSGLKTGVLYQYRLSTAPTNLRPGSGIGVYLPDLHRRENRSLS